MGQCISSLGTLLSGQPCCSLGGVGALASQDLEGVALHLQRCRHVIVMVGAGMSVSAGIPDFRSPGTGLYDNLQKYSLPRPEAVFDIDYFRRSPRAFYMLCRELWPGRYQPTASHYFVTLLHRRGLLQRCFTQNIDSLETLAGLPKDMVVAAHGNFDSATCIASGKAVPIADVEHAIRSGSWEALRDRHGGLVKPDIVFFGESLPARFFDLAREDFPRCDLLMVVGTSLQVHPFAGLVHKVGPAVPRILINRERVGEGGADGFQFDGPGTRDVFYRGDCDAGIQELVRLLGWEAEFEALVSGSRQQLQSRM